MFTHPFHNAFGLDLSDHSIKAVQLRRNPVKYHRAAYEVVSMQSLTIPHGLIVNGEIMEPEKVRTFLHNFITGEPSGTGRPIKSYWAVAALPEAQCFTKVLTIPQEPEELTDDIVLATAQKHLPFDQSSYYTDWQIIPSELRGETAVLLGAAPRRIADSYTYLAESVGLNLIALDVESLAIARAMITGEKSYEGESRAILDIGRNRSLLILFDEGTVQFSTTIPFSGKTVTSIFQESLQVSPEEAERLLYQEGLAYHKKGETLKLLAHAADELCNEISKTIRFYYSHISTKNKITHITLSGGGANMKRLPEIIEDRLKISCAPGNVWKNLRSKHNNRFSPAESLQYGTAIGLALRAADNPLLSNDLV